MTNRMFKKIGAYGLLALLTAVTTWSVVRALPVRAAPDSPLLKEVADIRLPGPSSRFDYQSFNPVNGRLYISHMDAGRVVVFDTRTNTVVANLDGFPEVTGVLVVPSRGLVYASVTGNHQVVVFNEKTLKIVARVPGIEFPDGIAYAPTRNKIFVSDESGGGEMVIDAETNRKIATIDLGGQAGNTQYDPISRHIFVAVQTRNQIVEIDPKTDSIVARYDLPGSDRPHGFTIDAPARQMFISCEGNAKLLVFDMRTMRVTSIHTVGDGPDVLAFDPNLRRLYVAAESGNMTIFDAQGTGLRKLGEFYAPHAHTVCVVPATRRVYFPLQDIDGKPVLRVMAEE